MKKKLTAILALALCILLCACGGTESAKIEKNDEGFLTLMAQGLEARWKLSDTTECESDEAYAAYAAGLVNAELEALGDLSEYTFADPTLKELAQQYYDALNCQVEGATYYLTDPVQYLNVFVGEGYNRRAIVISKLYTDYGLTVGEEYMDSITEFCNVAEHFASFDALAAQPLVVTNLGDECEMPVVNNTGMNLSEVVIEARFLDDSGNVVGDWTHYFEQWNNGSQEMANFAAYDIEYSQVEVRFTSAADYYSTEWLPTEYVNNMIVNIVADNLGAEVDFGYGVKKMGACKVTDFRFEISHWNDSQANVKLYFSGVKNDDEAGPDGRGHLSFTYGLLDESGNVAASGFTFLESLGVNEEFYDLEAYVGYLAPGTYRLVIEPYYLTF